MSYKLHSRPNFICKTQEHITKGQKNENYTHKSKKLTKVKLNPNATFFLHPRGLLFVAQNLHHLHVQCHSKSPLWCYAIPNPMPKHVKPYHGQSSVTSPCQGLQQPYKTQTKFNSEPSYIQMWTKTYRCYPYTSQNHIKPHTTQIKVHINIKPWFKPVPNLDINIHKN